MRMSACSTRRGVQHTTLTSMYYVPLCHSSLSLCSHAAIGRAAACVPLAPKALHRETAVREVVLPQDVSCGNEVIQPSRQMSLKPNKQRNRRKTAAAVAATYTSKNRNERRCRGFKGPHFAPKHKLAAENNQPGHCTTPVCNCPMCSIVQTPSAAHPRMRRDHTKPSQQRDLRPDHQTRPCQITPISARSRALLHDALLDEESSQEGGGHRAADCHGNLHGGGRAVNDVCGHKVGVSTVKLAHHRAISATTLHQDLWGQKGRERRRGRKGEQGKGLLKRGSRKGGEKSCCF